MYVPKFIPAYMHVFILLYGTCICKLSQLASAITGKLQQADLAHLHPQCQLNGDMHIGALQLI